MNSEKTVEVKVQRVIATSPAMAYDAWLNPKIPGNPWHTSDKLLFNPTVDGLESTVTVTFEKKGKDTLMTLVHAGLPDTDKGRSHEKGWGYFMDMLPAHFMQATETDA
jgi:uncharacterized protein YndB with AHSA1/START domain